MLKISRAALIAATLGLSVSWGLTASAAWAQDSSSGTASADQSSSSEDAQTTTSVTSVTIQSVAAVGSNMDEAAIRDALSGGFAKHVDEIAKLTATSINIPEVDVTFVRSGATPQNQTVALKDIELTNVKDGVADTASRARSKPVTPRAALRWASSLRPRSISARCSALMGWSPLARART